MTEELLCHGLHIVLFWCNFFYKFGVYSIVNSDKVKVNMCCWMIDEFLGWSNVVVGFTKAKTSE